MWRGREVDKLPVPGPWQAAVLAAMRHLGERLRVGRDEIAVTRAEPRPGDDRALEVWLLSGGRTYRYVAGLAGDGAEPATS